MRRRKQSHLAHSQESENEQKRRKAKVLSLSEGMGDIAIDGIALGIDAGTEPIESPAKAQRTKVILRVVAAYTEGL